MVNKTQQVASPTMFHSQSLQSLSLFIWQSTNNCIVEGVMTSLGSKDIMDLIKAEVLNEAVDNDECLEAYCLGKISCSSSQSKN